MKTTQLLLVCFLAFLAAAFHAGAASSNPPERMTYQGFLTDGSGNPLGNTNTGPKNYDVIFRIYDAQTSGTELWGEQQTVTVDKGYFSALLGEGSQYLSEPHSLPLSCLFTNNTASDRYVEMTVKGIGAGSPAADVTIMPRLRLLTSPYAFLARNATALVNGNAALITSSGNSVLVNAPLSAPSVGAAQINAGSVQVTNALSAANANVSGTVSAASVNVSGTTSAGSVQVTNALSAASVNVSSTASAGALQVTNTVTASNFVGNGTIPIGGIIMWSGATNNIPDGWALCNGQTNYGQVTPNLQDRFVLGAGTNQVNAHGGSNTVTITTNQLPAHAHDFQDAYHAEKWSYLNGTDQGGYPSNGGYTNVSARSGYSGVTGANGSDSDNNTYFWRGWTTASAGQSSTTPLPIMPPYWALAYIMRVQ